MQDIIQLLPESLANQIAAGEVVQRPASVVKELLENAIDAGANTISVIVKEAGKTLIQVNDDGIGMSPTDARMSLERHATSKIGTSEDLFTIKTFGFRGEALASIVAVAQVELKTRRETDEVGTAIRVEGSEVLSQEPEACSVGTSIAVKNLFFNVPARRKFLKSNPVELKHIIEEFQRVALANPEIAMALYQDDLETFHFRPGKLARRITEIFGKNYTSVIVPCQEEVQDVRIWGYVGKPEIARKTRGEQYFFVNGRFIKHPFLNHAVTNAYENMLKDGYYPFYAIHIEIDPGHVDVNVHPTKTEVKFDDERTLYAIVNAAVKQSLASYSVEASIDFGTDVNFLENASQNAPTHFKNMFNEKWAINDIENDERSQNNLKNWQTLYTDRQSVPSPIPSSAMPEAPTILKSAANELDEQESIEESSTKEKQAIQLRNKYILYPSRSGIMVVHQKAAYERILFEKFVRQLETQEKGAQKILFPKTVELPKNDIALLQEWKTEIELLGISWELFGENSIVVNGVSPDFEELDEKELIESLVEQIKHSSVSVKGGKHEKVAKILAKRAASTLEKPLETVEMLSLIEQLFTSSNPNFTPDGNKIVELLYLQDIEKLFR